MGGMRKNWQVLDRGTADLPPESDLHPVAGRLLANRGLTAPDEVRDFLHPVWESIPDAALFSQMGRAVARLFAALESGERLTVHGDYDADGVCSSAIMLTALREIEWRLRQP